MALEVIGAGFGRTGTTSLKVALEHLGYVKCHHMQEVIGRPEQNEAWYSVAVNGTGNWEAIFEGFRASLDWPSCGFYKALMEHFPDAKVILTVRDPEPWFRSTRETIYELRRSMPRWIKWVPRVRWTVKMLDAVVWEGVFHGRFEDAERSKQIFRDHIEDVKANVPKERLLVYDVRDGWGPLCAFLGVPAPEDVPFPHENQSQQFKRIVTMMRIVRVLPYVLVGALLVWVGFSFS
jgi:hypothetical protein